MSSDTVRMGETLVIRPCRLTPPEGKEFSHWNTKADGTGISYRPGQRVKMYETRTLYPIWRDAQ